MTQPIVISMRKAPGDTVVLTGFLRDLQRAYPGRYRVWADVNQPTLLANNPYVHEAGRWPDRVWPSSFLHLKLSYGLGIIRQVYEPVHFLAWFHRDFERQVGLHVPVTSPIPDLHLSVAELEPLVEGRYWLVVAGGKSDATVKIWSRAEWQRTVDLMRGLGLGVVQVGSRSSGHIHFDLDGTLNLVGETDLRELLRLIHHADGVICGVTAAMHMAAALRKPCVVVAGGREAWWWEAYVNQNRGFGPASGRVPVPHRYLHTIGLLPCGQGKHGCWQNKVEAVDQRELPCHYPTQVADQIVPECMKLITCNHVVRAAMSFYEDRTLPPIEPVAAVPLAPPSDQIAVARTRGNPAPPFDPLYDNDVIGGKLTAFVLMYGDYPKMHRDCLDSLILSTSRDRLEIRVISNQLGHDSLRYVQELMTTRTIAQHYRHPDNPGKYPAMRQAFRDQQRPITTNYLLWLDDDTICDRVPHWLDQLVVLIGKEHPDGARMFGPTAHILLQPGQDQWIRESAWYRGRPFRDKHGRETPQGNRVHFATGSFWALHVPTMTECDIPDPRIEHNGGDVMIGEQLHQMGYAVAPFSNDKTIVRWSDSPRRGRSEKPIGTR